MSDLAARLDGQTLRMVLFYEQGRPCGALYATDATAFSSGLATFWLDPEAPLPRLRAGAPVRYERGKVSWDDGSYRNVRLMTDHSGRIFGERGNVLVHPAVEGWTTSWRTLATQSQLPLNAWRDRTRRALRAFRWTLGFIALFLAITCIGLATGHLDFDGFRFWFWGGGGAAGLWEPARPSERNVHYA